jgi:M6 family metalloprotease-like protein
MKKLLLALLAQVFCLNLFAVPANPEPVTFLQSDGSELTVHLRGDEFFSWFETVDGYTLLRKENNDFVYAQLNQSDELSPTNFLAQNPNNRTLEEQNFLQNLGQRVVSKSDNIRKAVEQKNARHLERKNSIVPKNETIGTRQQIVVLAEYQDVRFLTSYSGTTWTGTQLFDSIMNGKNYTVNSARGSVQKYYQDNSLGQLTIETTVYGPVLLPRNRAWYGGNNQSGNDSNDRQMIRDALYILDTMSIDLTPFVNSGTGFVDGVHIIFAGCGEENPSCTSNAIWSHKWTLPEQPIYGGAQFYTYSCSPEVGGGNTSTTPTHIGVIAHEIGHTLGLWDMYDTYNGPFKGLGPWSVMADGAWNYSGRTPPYLNSFERFQLAWTTPIVLDYDAYYEITLPPLGVNDVSYVFYAKDASGNPIPNERFYLENRNTASSGGWDSQIYSNGGPATGGLMVYHMDSTNSTPWLTNNINSSNSAAGANPSGRENFKILSAKGTNSNYNLDPFSQSTMDSLTDNSTPNTQSWAGIPSNMPIKHIARNTSNNTVSFTVGHEPPCVETSFAFDDFFCQGGGYDFNGRWITAAGTYVDTVQN